MQKNSGMSDKASSGRDTPSPRDFLEMDRSRLHDVSDGVLLRGAAKAPAKPLPTHPPVPEPPRGPPGLATDQPQHSRSHAIFGKGHEQSFFPGHPPPSRGAPGLYDHFASPGTHGFAALQEQAMAGGAPGYGGVTSQSAPTPHYIGIANGDSGYSSGYPNHRFSEPGIGIGSHIGSGSVGRQSGSSPSGPMNLSSASNMWGSSSVPRTGWSSATFPSDSQKGSSSSTGNTPGHPHTSLFSTSDPMPTAYSAGHLGSHAPVPLPPSRLKLAPFGNIALRRFSFPHDGASELYGMLTTHDGQVDPYVCVRLQNVNPVSVLGVQYLDVANHFGIAMHKGFFCVCRTRLIRNFCAFCEVLCVRSRGPRACKAMVMSEEKLMTKLGRSTVEDLKARADQFDTNASRDLALSTGQLARQPGATGGRQQPPPPPGVPGSSVAPGGSASALPPEVLRRLQQIQAQRQLQRQHSNSPRQLRDGRRVGSPSHTSHGHRAHASLGQGRGHVMRPHQTQHNQLGRPFPPPQAQPQASLNGYQHDMSLRSFSAFGAAHAAAPGARSNNNSLSMESQSYTGNRPEDYPFPGAVGQHQSKLDDLLTGRSKLDEYLTMLGQMDPPSQPGSTPDLMGGFHGALKLEAEQRQFSGPQSQYTPFGPTTTEGSPVGWHGMSQPPAPPPARSGNQSGKTGNFDANTMFFSQPQVGSSVAGPNSQDHEDEYDQFAREIAFSPLLSAKDQESVEHQSSAAAPRSGSQASSDTPSVKDDVRSTGT